VRAKVRGKSEAVIVRALRTLQGEGLEVYAFFVRGADIVKIADISRIERDENDQLKGFQRAEIRTHVKGIVDYLNQGKVLFPNAIILALSPEVHFSASRGTRPTGDEGIAQAGTLTIPIFAPGERVAWIVDGQQRSLALSQAENQDIPVPVIAFVSDSLDIQREQFILVNKARPLPGRLINELLPETRGVLLPRDLSARKIPSELCGLLTRDPASPFYKLIKRPSVAKDINAVITDTAVINMIRTSINSPLGALAQFKATSNAPADLESMYRVLVTYWSAVKAVFPDAWGLDPRKSRLMHSVGIEAMGILMDRIWSRMNPGDSELEIARRELQSISNQCRWTKGNWEILGVAWNEIQNTPRDIKKLQDALIRLYSEGVLRR
jgi:DGQHR domain-containing protein